MGQAVCEHYVRLNLYFPSQLGVVCLKGVEVYVVKDMKAHMLIGKDTQSKWHLHTVQCNEGQYWQVGEYPHKIAAINGEVPHEQFSTSLAHEAPLGDATQGGPLPNKASKHRDIKK
jgi:hypothetical protein